MLLCAPGAYAYSVLTHQAIIDLAWDDSIRPFLLSRYPNATAEQLQVAHAYAYGGCAIQDMGYYPFGHTFFSDLTHYVRAGDFVASLFRNAQNLNDLAFAAGALSHYLGDSFGHSIATNQATPIEFPDLGARYGTVVTYEQDPHAHVRTEFGFDIEQVSKQRFAPHSYLVHIGLLIPRPLLEKAFFETYGMPLHTLLGEEGPSMRSYRSAVRSFIPFFARGEVVLHRHEFLQEQPSPEFSTYSEESEHADFRNHSPQGYRNPGFVGHLSAAIVWIVPKRGPAAMLAIKIPSHESQELYAKSMTTTLEHLHKHLGDLGHGEVTTFALADRDLDTGARTKPGGYARTDATYAKLLHDVVTRPQMTIPLGLKEDVLAYYADLNAPITTKQNPKQWAQVQQELEHFRTMKSTSQVLIPSEP